MKPEYSFYIGDGKQAWTAKAVDTAKGQAIARNWKGDLDKGDLGILILLDLSKVEAMTPEQRLASHDLLEGMYRAALRKLGKEEIEGSGIAIGSYVRLPDYESDNRRNCFRLDKETRTGLHLCRIENGIPGKTSVFTWKDLSSIQLLSREELIAQVVEILTAQLWANREFQAIDLETDIHLRISLQDLPDHLRRFSRVWGEEALTSFFLATPVEQASVRRAGLVMNWRIITCREQPWLLPALGILTEEASLERVAKEAKQSMVREAAEQLLQERATASATG